MVIDLRRALALAFVLLLAAPAAGASGAVISFDNLSAPARGGHGLPVNSQYNGQGVTFNNPEAFNYASGAFAIPGFAHSGSIAVEPCVAIEFCIAPVRATFTAAQRSVRVWVGFSSPLSAPLGVRLTAFNASSTVVGTDNATLPVRSTPTPIQTPLELTLASPAITRIDVTVTTGGGYSNGLAVDDVEFSTVGPPPPCPAATPPVISVLEPAAATTVHNNAFLLQGTVDGRGAPITNASVLAQSAATRSAAVFPTLIDADGGPFGPVSFHGLLAEGANDVIVTATNCRGTGTSAASRVTWAPVPSGTRFEQLGMIEVTQTVQNPTNGVPLIAASAGGVKRTFARVYLKVGKGFSRVSGVSGVLSAFRPDGSRAPGPLGVRSLNSIRVLPLMTRRIARSGLNRSLNFELPPAWLAAGRLHLRLDHLEIGGIPSTLPCDRCDNRIPLLGLRRFVRFHATPPLRIWLVNVPYRTSPTGPVIAPRPFDVDMLTSWLRRAYPASDIRITRVTMPTLDQPPPDCHAVNARIAFWVLTNPPVPDRRTHFYGLVADNSHNNFMGGCALIGGPIGSGPAGIPGGPRNFAIWDTDGSYTDAYGGHELGHTYGRRHPGFCHGQDRGDPFFPYDGGLLGSSRYDNQGFDSGDAALGLPMQVNDWRAGWHDVMSYCDNQWPSYYTYRAILLELCELEGTCSAAQFGPGDFDLPGPLRSRPFASTETRRGARAGRLRVAISGSLLLRSGRASLAPLTALPGLPLTDRPRRSRYSIVLRGPRGRVLARYPFSPKRESEPRGSQPIALIQEVVPFDPATRRVVIERGRRELTSAAVSGHTPRIRILAPRRRASKVTVRWRSRDADGGRLTYSLLYSPGGERFLPVAAGLRKRSYRVDLRRLPGGRRARFRVIVTDGVRAAADTSGPLRVVVKRPRVRIAAPLSGAQLPAGTPVQLVATVADLQHSRFPASRVVWHSSLQGGLGRGTTIAASLQPGSHVLSVRATNRGRRSRVARISVNVVAAPPRMDASLAP